MNQQPNEPMQPTVMAHPIGNQTEAQQVIGQLSDVMDALVGLVDEETKLVRAGRLSEVVRLAGQKTKLARLYLGYTARLQASQDYLLQAVPGVLQVLRERHNTFRAMLQVNLTVLATAHAVAEGIIRGVSEEINRQSAPQIYGASGRRTTPDTRNARPLALSRVL
jgi:flagellar biosynthesis/type III secretory pathway chaperone